MAEFNVITTAQSVKTQDPNDFVKCDPPSRIAVLIVGAGVGNLMAALECHHKGHRVRILGRSETATTGGDMFTIGLSGRGVLDHYPAIEHEFDIISLHDNCTMYRIQRWESEGKNIKLSGNWS